MKYENFKKVCEWLRDEEVCLDLNEDEIKQEWSFFIVENKALDIPVNGSLLEKIEKELGSRNNKFDLWHDGGEWIISKDGDQKQSKTLKEIVDKLWK